MAKSLRLQILTPTECLVEVEAASWVQAQLSDGSIGIWPGHAPLLAETIEAKLRYADALGDHALDLPAGILQIEPDGVTILTPGRVETDCT